MLVAALVGGLPFATACTPLTYSMEAAPPKPLPGPCPRAGQKVSVAAVRDARQQAAPEDAGRVHLGLWNNSHILKLEPAPAELLRAQITEQLAACGATPMPGAPAVQLWVELQRFVVAEAPGFSTEVMTVAVVYEAKVQSPDGSRLGTCRASATAEDSSAWDTTNYAPRLMEEAMTRALAGLLPCVNGLLR